MAYKSVKIDVEHHAELKRLSKDERRTIIEIVHKALEEYVAQREGTKG